MKPKTYDFGGYATRHDIQCSDGRTIRSEAFKDADGKKVPLVYHHIHDEISNVLGHAILEHRNDGVYAYCTFNNSEKAQLAKEAVQHGDITALSIYANRLKQRAGDVLHGIIREVSLVLSGANPEALIDNVAFKHGDDFETSEDDVIIYSGKELELSHADNPKEEDLKEIPESGTDETKKEAKMADKGKERTVQDVYDEFTEEQKAVVDALVGAAVEAATEGELDVEVDEEEVIEQSGIGGRMKKNVFEGIDESGYDVISHADMEIMFNEMKRGGTLKETLLAHSITNIEVLFPEARNVTATPETVSRQMEWVTDVLNSVKKSPFSRVKSMSMDITADEARAKGYVKGREKIEEVIVAARRSTTPQTIYKKQKLDRDDVIDIIDFDVIAYVNAEMRVMLNEEIARALLIGDGRAASDNDKINPLNVRPVWQDDTLYTTNKVITLASAATADDRAKAFIDEVVRQRKNYKGSGSPTMYIGVDLLTDLILLKDTQGYRLYKTEAELAAAMRVSRIVEVEAFDGQTRVDGSTTYNLAALVVNLMDYTVGADKGGEITNFEDFDIDFNQHKYLIETRISGALVKPKAALSFEFLTVAGGVQA